MQPSGAAASICLKISSFNATFSVAASTTSCAFLTPSATVVEVTIFFKVFAF
jgi:hypothetical protein